MLLGVKNPFSATCYTVIASSACCATIVPLETQNVSCMSTTSFPGRAAVRPEMIISGPFVRPATLAAAIALLIRVSASSYAFDSAHRAMA